ncbi:MAG: NAD-dependent epimerase/dehydratase family protein, partial [Pseudomonadota bacterium]
AIPTPETEALRLPDSLNPRYSYGGSKIVTELIAFNYAKEHFQKVQAFRPHNIYGADMGWKHVIPQFVQRAAAALDGGTGPAPFPIQGDGKETRAFCHVNDAVSGILTMYDRGAHREVYHIGTQDEVSMRDLAERVGRTVGGTLDIQPGPAPEGGTPRRCPDISKMRALGYAPQVSLDDGLKDTVAWYLENPDDTSGNALM